MALRPQGSGYASEAGAAVIAYARETLGVSTFAAVTDARNAPSIRVLKKPRFEFASTEHVHFKQEWCAEQKYVLTG